MRFSYAERSRQDARGGAESLDTVNLHAAGFDIPGAQLTVHTAVVREKRTGHNVAG